MKKVKITDFGVIHTLAHCEDCQWDGTDLDVTKMKAGARKHVAKTGHTVNIESVQR